MREYTVGALLVLLCLVVVFALTATIWFFVNIMPEPRRPNGQLVTSDLCREAGQYDSDYELQPLSRTKQGIKT